MPSVRASTRAPAAFPRKLVRLARIVGFAAVAGFMDCVLGLLMA
jgi:hypothetical protein